jgi:hypothetical protein
VPREFKPTDIFLGNVISFNGNDFQVRGEFYEEERVCACRCCGVLILCGLAVCPVRYIGNIAWWRGV